MDIKSFILIGGGLLIAAVVAHGFWIAWRDRRQELRIDIKPDLIPDEADDLDRLRGELPNGGARVIRPPAPEQAPLDLEEPPLLELEPSEGPPRTEARGAAPTERSPFATPAEVDSVLLGNSWDDGASRTAPPETADSLPVTNQRTEPVMDAPGDVAAGSGAIRDASIEEDRARVADVALPEPVVADAPRRPRRLGQQKPADRGGRSRGTGTGAGDTRESTAGVPVEELIVMNVLAEPASLYTGEELFRTLRSCGLKFGDMNIFHRTEPITRIVQYSVASAVEPGTFDMADIEAVRCPGLCMFMQLPGPTDPSGSFEDMLSVARSVTASLGGEIKDEHRNVMTPQTVQHYRQRIVDFSRRRMSKRA